MALEVTIRQIKSWRDDSVLWEGEAASLKDALEKAVKSGASLDGASLHGRDKR